jgi:ubiquinone/menaquinone biosynthesis C-methylase UbiE
MPVFETLAGEYDAWFENNRLVYESEIRALKTFWAPGRRHLEVGVGTGRFAVPLGVSVGVEPARAMAAIARRRGIRVIRAVAEALPFAAGSFDQVLMVTVLCFFTDPVLALTEAARVLTASGQLLIGMIDKDSPLGRLYEARRHESPFYRNARFYPVSRVLGWLRRLGFRPEGVAQTIFRGVSEISSLEPVKAGHGEGGFVVISARKVDRTAAAA